MKPLTWLPTRPSTVLVVEDSAEDVCLLERASRQVPSALAFHFVHSGEDALAYLKGEGRFADRKAHPEPELVLLDVGLPGLDGFEVLNWIRSQPELQDLKVFVWTDAGEPEILQRASQAGANRFVPKSVAFVRGGMAGLISGIAQAIGGPAERSERERLSGAAATRSPESPAPEVISSRRLSGGMADSRSAEAGKEAGVPGPTVPLT